MTHPQWSWAKSAMRLSPFLLLPLLFCLAMLFASVPALAQTGACGTYCNGNNGKNWKVSRAPIMTTTNGTPSQTGLVVTVAAPQGFTMSYTYESDPNQCTAYVSLSFPRYDSKIGESSYYLGQCILSGPKGLVEASKPLPLCGANNPLSWIGNCTMPQVCPTPGTSQYACGTNNVNDPAGTPWRVCSCNPQTLVGGLGSACIPNGTGGGTYYCGNKEICPCTAQNTAAATAKYCTSTTAPTGSCIQMPNPENLVAAQSFTSPYIATIEQYMDQLATNSVTVPPQSLVNAVLGLDNETIGCTVPQ